MSKCFIGIGKCSYFYFYLLGLIILNALKRALFQNKNITFNKHLLIKSVYKYFSYIIFGALFHIILKKYLIKEKKVTNNKKILTYNKKTISTTVSLFSIFTVCIIYVIYYESKTLIVIYKLRDLMFWPVHLAFLLLFINIYFPQNIHKHNKYPMIVVIILGFIEAIITVILNFNKEEQNEYQKVGVILCISIIISFMLITILFSFSEVEIKVLSFFYPLYGGYFIIYIMLKCLLI